MRPSSKAEGIDRIPSLIIVLLIVDVAVHPSQEN